MLLQQSQTNKGHLARLLVHHDEEIVQPFDGPFKKVPRSPNYELYSWANLQAKGKRCLVSAAFPFRRGNCLLGSMGRAR